MGNDWIIERDKDDNKVRRQLTDAEQAKRDKRPPRVPKPDPDLEGALRLLAVGHVNQAAIEALLNRMRG